MTAPASPLTLDLVARFPGLVQTDTRPGYSGFIVEKDSLLEVAAAVRDELGFDLMTAVTGFALMRSCGMSVSISWRLMRSLIARSMRTRPIRY